MDMDFFPETYNNSKKTRHIYNLPSPLSKGGPRGVEKYWTNPILKIQILHKNQYNSFLAAGSDIKNK